MFPIVYNYNETLFTSMGLGSLPDCTSCIVTEELNGEYSLTLKYPKGGLHEEYLTTRNIIVCQPNHTLARQAFRIYKVNRTLKESITVYAYQLAYDLSGCIAYSYEGITTDTLNLRESAPSGNIITVMPANTHFVLLAKTKVSNNTWYKIKLDEGTTGWCQSDWTSISIGAYPVSVDNAAEAIELLNLSSGDFVLSTNKTTSAEFILNMPASVRSWFAGKTGSLIDLYGGEYEYDMWNVYLKASRGADRGARISYGVNVAQYVKEVTDQAYNKIVPYFAKKDGDVLIEVNSSPAEISTGVTGTSRKLAVDVTSMFPSEYGKIMDFGLLGRTKICGSGSSGQSYELAENAVFKGVNCTNDYPAVDSTKIARLGGITENGFYFETNSSGKWGIALPVKLIQTTPTREFYYAQINRFAVTMKATGGASCEVVFTGDDGVPISKTDLGQFRSVTEKYLTSPTGATWAIFRWYRSSAGVVIVSDLQLVCKPEPIQVGAEGTNWLAKHPQTADHMTITVEPEVLSTQVSLGDTVHVFLDDDTALDTRVVKTVWDVLADQYQKIELGTLKTSITETIKSLNTEGIAKSIGSGSGGGGGTSIVVDSALSGTSTNPVENRVITNTINSLPYALSNSHGGAAVSALQTAGIPFGQVDSTSTSTVFTATISGITSLYDGVCVLLKNGVVTSASGCMLNINGLGAKPIYSNLAAATADTTIFNVNYTMLFIYDSTRVSGGCWICYRGYDSNTNTIGYQIRTNSAGLKASDKFYRYRLLFTSADGTKFVPANTSTSTNATVSRTVNSRPIDPFGAIVYYGTTAAVDANTVPSVTALWQQYNITLGYSFNTTGAALTLSYPAPVYLKCSPQSNGSAIMNSIVQALPNTEDGYIYIFLGIAYSATAIELRLEHPVYYYKNGSVRRWTGVSYVAEADLSDKLVQLGIYPSHIMFDTTANWNAQATLVSELNAVYVYTDYQTADNQDIAGFKVGDGLAYVIDLPFVDKIYKQHVENSTIHITQAEREFWNNKNRAYISLADPETMVLTIN